MNNDLLALNFEIILKLLESKKKEGNINNTLEIKRLEGIIQKLKDEKNNIVIHQDNSDIDNCKKVLAKDIITDIDYFKQKLENVNWLLSGADQQYLQDKLKSYKNVITGEYYFNNMIAKNLSDYKCNKIFEKK
jgi:hypothetical protein